MLMVAGACLSSLRDYLGFVNLTTGWHPWLMTFMPSALLGRGNAVQYFRSVTSLPHREKTFTA